MEFTVSPIMFASFALPLIAAAAGTAAIAAPLIIHLLTRQRFQIVEWAAMRFLQVEQKRHKRRIDHWPLMLARVLLLGLVLAGLCAATPWAESIWQKISPGAAEYAVNAPRTHHIVVVDASMSMATLEGNKTRFDKAIESATQLLQNANPGDGFSLLVLNGSTTVVVPGPANDVSKVLVELPAIKLTHAPADIGSSLNAISEIVSRSPKNYPRRQVTFITDTQRSSWSTAIANGDRPAPDAWPRILSRADVAIVDVAKKDVDNLAVTDISLADPLPLVEQPTVVTVSVQNFGKTDRRGVRVELLVGRPSQESRLLPAEQKMIDSIPPGERATVSFQLDGRSRFRDQGLHLIQAKLADADELPTDDLRQMVVDVRASLNVVVVNGRNSSEPLKRASGYLADALAPGGKVIPGNPIKPKVISMVEFSDAGIGDLSTADCVILCDVPSLTPSQIARIDAVLKRGGGVLIGLGPQTATNLAALNKQLHDDGKGILPGKLIQLIETTESNANTKVNVNVDQNLPSGFRLAADDEAFRKAPLDAFRDDNARGGLTAVPFKAYVKVLKDDRAQRIMSFIPATAVVQSTEQKNSNQPVIKVEPKVEDQKEANAAVLEMTRHRGRVVLLTSSLNSDHSDWPLLPSYLPFVHEMVRHVSTSPDRHTLNVGEGIEEFLPDSTFGLQVTIRTPDGGVNLQTIQTNEDTLSVRSFETMISGIYRMVIPGKSDRYFAVNPIDKSSLGGSESDLRRVDPAELNAISPSIQIVNTPDQIRLLSDDGSGVATATPRPHGPWLARWLLLAALSLMIIELWLAWRSGPARKSVGKTIDDQSQQSTRLFRILFAVIPIAIVCLILYSLIHYAASGQFLGYLPDQSRNQIEKLLGVPGSGPGEGTRWRLESFPIFSKSPLMEKRILWGVTGLAVLLCVLIYLRERFAVGKIRWISLPILLRLAAILLTLFVLLPQLRLAFDREGWPDIVILVDTSESMATNDLHVDAEIKQAAEKLVGAKAVELATNRLALAKALLTTSETAAAPAENGWIAKLLSDREVKVHVYSIADELRLADSAERAEEKNNLIDETRKFEPTGKTSRLGDGIKAVLNSFRGGSLPAIILLTDGQTTAGDSLAKAGLEAARAGVPLYIVGLGDVVSSPDLSLSDLRADDIVTKGDQIVFDARLTAKGPIENKPLNITLSEIRNGKSVELNRVTIRPDTAGKPVPFRLTHTPKEAGEKNYVIEVAGYQGETELANNKIERVILVTDSKQLKVLMIEGYPRYEYRYIKDWLERQAEANAGAGASSSKSISLNTLLLSASKDFALLDKSALRSLPTRDELFQYDVIFFGDVDPKQIPAQTINDIAEFVKIRGGGLVVIAGEQAMPHKFFETAFADLLPILPAGTIRPTVETQPITEGYRPRLTAIGQVHPLFRFASDETENAKIWATLKPLLWHATGYKRKLSSEVLAVHPEKPAVDTATENHPLVLQQFVGAGRVVFFGFDETWRWRFRDDEIKFGQFWMQAIRVLGRNRVRRIDMRTDRQTPYRTGEPIKVTIRFPDDTAAPDASVPVRILVERNALPGQTAESETQTIQLTKIEGSRGTFEGSIIRSLPGDYRLRMISPEQTNTTPPRAEAKVLPPPGERERLDLNETEIAKAAAESRGKWYTLATASKLIDELPEAERVPLNQPCPPIPLWNHAASFGLMFLLLVTEWWYRRRERLV